MAKKPSKKKTTEKSGDIIKKACWDLCVSSVKDALTYLIDTAIAQKNAIAAAHFLKAKASVNFALRFCPEEKELEESIERGEWQPVKGQELKAEKKIAKQAAKKFFKGKKKVRK